MSLRRREFLRLGLGGFASLALADLFRLQAESPAAQTDGLVCLWNAKTGEITRTRGLSRIATQQR